MKWSLLLACGVAIGLVAAGCGGGEDGNGGGPAANARRESPSSGGDVRTERLTEQELLKFLEVWPELVEKMQKFAPGRNFWGTGIVVNADIEAYLASKGTKLQDIANTLAKVSMALGAYNAKEALRKAEELPPQARAGMEAAFESFKDVPEENIDLIGKHLDEIKAAMASGEGE